MKKVIFIGLLMACLSTINSQVVSISLPVGLSTLKVPTIGANVQLWVKGLILAGGFDAQVSKKVEHGNFYWSRIGGALHISELNHFELSGGIGQYRKSADIKGINKSLGLANVQYVHQMANRPEGALFLSVTSTKKFTMVTGGIRFIFGRGVNGCPSTRIR